MEVCIPANNFLSDGGISSRDCVERSGDIFKFGHKFIARAIVLSRRLVIYYF